MGLSYVFVSFLSFYLFISKTNPSYLLLGSYFDAKILLKKPADLGILLTLLFGSVYSTMASFDNLLELFSNCFNNSSIFIY